MRIGDSGNHDDARCNDENANNDDDDEIRTKVFDVAARVIESSRDQRTTQRLNNSVITSKKGWCIPRARVKYEFIISITANIRAVADAKLRDLFPAIKRDNEIFSRGGLALSRTHLPALSLSHFYPLHLSFFLVFFFLFIS